MRAQSVLLPTSSFTSTCPLSSKHSATLARRIFRILVCSGGCSTSETSDARMRIRSADCNGLSILLTQRCWSPSAGRSSRSADDAPERSPSGCCSAAPSGNRVHHATAPHLFRVAEGLHAALFQHQHFVGQMEDLIQRMADVEHRNINFAGQTLQVRQKLALARYIQRSQRLVEQQQFGAVSNARPIATRCFSPPESEDGSLSSRGSMPKSVTSLSNCPAMLFAMP